MQHDEDPDQSVESFDPLDAVDSTLWSLAAVVSTMRDAAEVGVERALALDVARTGVLVAANLLYLGPDGHTLLPSLVSRTGAAGRGKVDAILNTMRQAAVAAAGDVAAFWPDHGEEMLSGDGNSGIDTANILVTKLVPQLDGLAARLDLHGARMLDAGTGSGAVALAMARALPHLEVLGIDVSAFPLGLAVTAIAAEPQIAQRISLRQQDLANLAERDAFDLVWLPAPSFAEHVLRVGLAQVAQALRPGGWVVVSTNPQPADRLASAVARWNAVRRGGSDYAATAMGEELTMLGLEQVESFMTGAEGPILVAARRPLG